ncbi:MAG: hemin uptake protein HemP [Polaromonas sp.]
MNQNRLPLATSGTRPGCVESAEILQGQKTVEINHNGSTYRLQATRLGKLILTK